MKRSETIKKFNPGKGLSLSVLIIIIAIFGVVVSATIPVVEAKTTTRPIDDFVKEQGTYCIDDGEGGCILFVPPVKNFAGWDNIKDDTNPPPLELVRLASIDYAGLANAYIESASGSTISLGTTTDGIITERGLPDGRAVVKIRLHTKNALTWIVRPTEDPNDNDFASGPLLFGVRAPDVLGGANPALGDSFLKLVFINTAPGDPMPDLLQLFIEPKEGQEPISISFHAQADGELREAFGVADGTPGRAVVAQTGLFATAFKTEFKGALADGFPAELINLKVVGK